VDDQEDELELIRRNRSLEQDGGASAVSSTFNAEFQEGFSRQQREISELRGLIQALHDGFSRDGLSRHPAYDAMLQKLRSTKSQLFALHEAHEMTVKHQASRSHHTSCRSNPQLHRPTLRNISLPCTFCPAQLHDQWIHFVRVKPSVPISCPLHARSGHGNKIRLCQHRVSLHSDKLIKVEF
jgi:hypothetical protein